MSLTRVTFRPLRKCDHGKSLCYFLYFRFDQTEGIIVIGATNFPEILDKYASYYV